jgi:hypothetical protein
MIESFPLSAWNTLGIKHLPSKAKCRQLDKINCVANLLRLFPLRLPPALTHDQIQAVVAGLGGLAIERCRWDGCAVAGVPPKIEDEHWREGLIINPKGPWSDA